MRRREFLVTLGGAAAWPLAVRAQQPERMRRIGVLLPFPANNAEAQARMEAFLQGLQQLGWTNGRNVLIDTRWATANTGEIRRHVAEMVALVPDVIALAGTGSRSGQPKSCHGRGDQRHALGTGGIVSSRARSPPTCRCRRRPSTN
jgi:hypothetical protein